VGSAFWERGQIQGLGREPSRHSTRLPSESSRARRYLNRKWWDTRLYTMRVRAAGQVERDKPRPMKGLGQQKVSS
jgi:hypothetical protein